MVCVWGGGIGIRDWEWDGAAHVYVPQAAACRCGSLLLQLLVDAGAEEAPERSKWAQSAWTGRTQNVLRAGKLLDVSQIESRLIPTHAPRIHTRTCKTGAGKRHCLWTVGPPRGRHTTWRRSGVRNSSSSCGGGA